MPSDRAHIAPYQQSHPSFGGPSAFLGARAAVLGKARIGRNAWLASHSVVRADANSIEIGEDFHLGVGATVHVSDDCGPTIVGARTTVLPNAVVHACHIGGDCFIGENAIVLDGAQIGDGAMIFADSVIYPRSQLPGGWLYAGHPARPVRRIDGRDLLRAHNAARRRAISLERELETVPGARNAHDGRSFIASTAMIRGRLSAYAGSSIWYSCQFEASHFEISIGANSNVQDNVKVTCGTQDVRIGANTTIGHNASVTDCVIGNRTLIGIGARLAPFTTVADDVLLAAGSETEPGQILDSGSVWGGRPARRIKDLDEKTRALLARIPSVYCALAREFQRPR